MLTSAESNTRLPIGVCANGNVLFLPTVTVSEIIVCIALAWAWGIRVPAIYLPISAERSFFAPPFVRLLTISAYLINTVLSISFASGLRTSHFPSANIYATGLPLKSGPNSLSPLVLITYAINPL